MEIGLQVVEPTDLGRELRRFYLGSHVVKLANEQIRYHV
jgi:hypothetical protein